MPNAAEKEHVLLEDQTLRDGLQNESRIFSLDEKIRIFNLLVDAGIKQIQAGSFVHPRWVPQMADTDVFVKEVLPSYSGVLTGLVLNRHGLERALDCGVKSIGVVVSASETHSRKNVNRSMEEALADTRTLISEAKQAGLFVQATISCSFGCVYEGAVPEDRVISLAESLAEAGTDGISFGDTTGMGNPFQVKKIVGRAKNLLPGRVITLHMHDTRGLGLANMLAAYELGVRNFDTCTGGLGGCPFVKGAAGNVPTEDTVNLFEQIGARTGIDLQRLCSVVDVLESLLGRKLPGRMNRVLKGAPQADP